MPADHLIPTPDTSAVLERAVLAVLTGTPAGDAAAGHPPLSAADVLRAAQRYQTAGRAALAATAGRWHQVNIEFPDGPAAAHTVATRLLPALQGTHASAEIGPWWYIRKTPRWRLRLRAHDRGLLLPAAVTTVLDHLTTQQLIIAWSQSRYEPEIHAFGGPHAMAAAHRFFHRDSENILIHLGRTSTPPHEVADTLPTRELSLLMCTTLLRAAGLDWYEQGDVWYRIAHMRPLPPDTTGDRLPHLSEQLRQLFATDVGPILAAPTAPPPLTTARPWLDAAIKLGGTLRELAARGELHRGLRDVLAHHVIFHWNRLGLATVHQAVLANAAAVAILPPTGAVDVATA